MKLNNIKQMKIKTKIHIFSIIAFSMLIISSVSIEVKAATTIKDLKVEYVKNPIGIDVAKPRFSWKMESDVRGAAQAAYQILVSTDKAGNDVIWDSGKTDSDKSVQIEYDGTSLSPMTRYYWKVSVWDNDDAQTSSE
ncbi:MAG: hypothetical protein AB7D35_14445, partial [Bacteroidales bacterium]